MEALVQMVVGPPEDVDDKTRFKYVLFAELLELCITDLVNELIYVT